MNSSRKRDCRYISCKSFLTAIFVLNGMDVLKNKLKFFWALWGLVFFAFTLLVVTPLYIMVFLIMEEKKGERVALRISRGWAKSLMVAYLVRIKVHNREVLEPGRSYVMVTNHRSQLDIPVCAVASRHCFKFLAKEELVRVPLLGFVIKRLYVTVSRKSGRDRARSLEKMRNALKAGISVMIYPEGTRNRTGEPVKSFYDGAFVTAIKSGRPLAILVIKGTGELLPPGEVFRFSPGTVHCYWEQPLETTGMTSRDVSALKQKTREIMINRIMENGEG